MTTDLINARIAVPSIKVSFGGIPTVNCRMVLRAEGVVPRFDIEDADCTGTERIQGITTPMLREWFEGQGCGGFANRMANLCADIARSMVEDVQS